MPRQITLTHNRPATVLAGLAFIVFAMLGAPAWAELSRGDAASVAQRLTGGRILSIEPYDITHRAVWRVKVLTPQGEVRVILLDPVSGEAL